jgi:malonyl-CoA O-methyltransferase
MTKDLSLHHYPCTAKPVVDFPLVLIHGWGNDSRVWQEALPLLRQQLDVVTLDIPGFSTSVSCSGWQEAVEVIGAHLPKKCILMGWSLGGMLATRLAHRYSAQVEKLITLATNPSFVCRTGWPTAMTESVFASFYNNFDNNPDSCLRQFCALEAHGDTNERSLLRWLRTNSADCHKTAWLQALGWLRELDNRELLATLKVPSLHIFGAGDQLVPVAAAEQLRALNPKAEIAILSGVGHAPHLSRPSQLVQRCLDFIGAAPGSGETENPYRLNKREVAASFGRAAASYDSVAHLQRQVGEKLLAKMPANFLPSHIADVGCGTGHFTRRLATIFSDAQCTGIDIAPGMVNYAAAHSGAGLNWVCADAESMPIADNSFDLLYSNFTYQWCQNLPRLMAEQFRLLKAGGLLVFTTVGPQSLSELRRAWQAVDNHVHVNQFAPLGEVKNALRYAGFVDGGAQVETLVRHYSQLNELTRELKNLGAHNINRGRNSGMTSRLQIEKFKAAYEALRQPSGLPATWEILYMVARKP